MDIEGIDVAVIYGTAAARCSCTTTRPKVAAAAGARPQRLDARLLRLQPERLKFRRPARFHDIGECVKEARRAVRELGAVA